MGLRFHLTSVLLIAVGVEMPSAALIEGGLGGGGRLPRDQGSICLPLKHVIEIEIDRMIESTRRKNSLKPLAHTDRPGVTIPPFAFYPQSGVLWEDLWPNNFVDLDASEDFSDWNCSQFTYDGHLGVDTGILTFSHQLIGVPVFAALDGEIVAVHDGETDRNLVWDDQDPNFVIISHRGVYQTRYLHLKKGSISVSAGQSVKAGQQIGLTASSGVSTAPHLHFETRFWGQVLEPFTGPCNDFPSLWANQRPMRKDTYLREFVLTTQDLNNFEGPPRNTSRIGSFTIGKQKLFFWTVVQNLAEDRTWRIRILRPDGSLAIDSKTRSDSNPFHRWSWWWWWWNVDLDQIGTWQLELIMHGKTLTLAPFSVTSAPQENLPPHPIEVEFATSNVTQHEPVVCQLRGFSVLDDPDYDIVRYEYKWQVGESILRQTISAGRSDVLSHGLVKPGDTLRCIVTPSDGKLAGDSAEATAIVGGFEGLDVPLIDIQRLGEDLIVISWARTSKNYRLEGTTQIQSRAWIAVSAAPKTISGRVSLTLPLDERTVFFRLSE